MANQNGHNQNGSNRGTGNHATSGASGEEHARHADHDHSHDHHGHHHNTTPLGMQDVIAGAVLFVIFAFLLKLFIEAVKPGMFTWNTFAHTLVSGFTFLGIWAFLGNKLFRPYLEVVEQRETATVGAEARAVELRRETQRIQAEIEEQLRQARVEGIKRRDAQVDEAKKNAAAVLERVSSQAGERLKSAHAEIAELRRAAEREVESESQKLAALVCERALETGPSVAVYH